MLRPAIRYGLLTLGVAALAVAAALGLFGWSLLQGPVPAHVLRPVIERALAAQVDGGKAVVGGVEAVWFADQRALGLRLTRVSLVDGQGRPVLKAAMAESGLALESLGRLTPAPARLAARDFFAAVSVSPQGRYALGYEAQGAPPPMNLRRLMRSFTGEPRRGRPVSFVRYVDFDDGVVVLNEVKGPVAWKGAIDRLSFRKSGGRLAADARLSIDDGAGRAALNGRMRGAVGLGDLSASGAVAGLTPARIFPASGFARRLSAFDAPVQGRGRVQYALAKGITSADVTASAGTGQLRLGRMVQRLDDAQIVTHYDPATKKVQLRSFRLNAERTQLDASGALWLAPEKPGSPAQVHFALASAESLLTIAPTATPQRIDNLVAHGRFLPKAGRLEVEKASLLLAGAPVQASAMLFRGPDPDLSWGLKAKVDVAGVIGPRTAAAFWPESKGRGARLWFVKNIHDAQVSNVRLTADLPPGQLSRFKLANPMLQIAFDFAGAAASITPTLPRIERASGRGLVQGDRFDLTMTSGRMQDIALTEGVVEIPRFKPRGVRATFKARAVGDLGEMLAVVDRPPLRLMTPTGMSPSRLAGRADIRLEITRPMLRKVPLGDYGVHYAGRWDGGSIRNVGAGLDLEGGRMAVEGSLQEVVARGAGRVGPYVGKIEFRSDLDGVGKGTKVVDLDGAVDVAGAAAGRASDGAPFKARLTTRQGEGGAVIRSPVFDGRATWKGKRRVTLEGVGEPAAWRIAGLPVGPGLPARVPVKLTLGGAGGAWSGLIEADAYSGALTLTGGAAPKLRYVAEISPDEARRLGLADFPMFARSQTVVLEAGTKGGLGSADYALGGMSGRMDWGPGKERGAVVYRFKTKLDRTDLAGLGVPFGPAAAMPVDATVTGSKGAFAGQAEMAGANLRFNVSARKAGKRQIALAGEAPASTLVRLGLADADMIGGAVDLTGRLDHWEDGRMAGRLEAGLERAALAIPDSDWRKPAGRPARAFADVTIAPDGTMTLDNLTAEGPGLELAGSGRVAKGRLTSLSLRTARLDGFFDGAADLTQSDKGLDARISGRFLDARPILKRVEKAAGERGGSGAARTDPIQLEANLAQVRLSEKGYVRDVKVSGVWGAPEARRLTIAAATTAGSAVSGRAYADKGGTALALKVADLGDLAKSLGAFSDLEGGQATGNGRLAPGGYDITFDIRDVRVVRAPAMAQLLTVASLQGLADTLNGTGIYFARIHAPVKVRGSQMTLGQTRATGPALGLTAKGVVDLEARVLDINGVIAPAYGLNSAAGALPVVGPLLVSRQGEGLFGLTYSARGPFDAPRVLANPLSIAAPGMLRRMFEGPTPKAKLPAAAPAG